MEEDDFDFLEEFLSREPQNNFDYLDLFEFVVIHKNFKMELTEFFVIENGFRECWNSNTGKLVGDGEFKNYVYRYIEEQLDAEIIPKPIPQKKVDACVDLILKYLSTIGQFSTDFSAS